MRVTEPKAPATPPGAAGVRVYSLEIVRDREQRLKVVDLNGARSSFLAHAVLYGDDRVERRVVSAIADESLGLLELNQVGISDLEHLVSSEHLRSRFSGKWYSGSQLYVPEGVPFSTTRARSASDVADSLAIPYGVVEISTGTTSPKIALSRDSSLNFAGLAAKARLWPYSWDQRLLELGEKSINPDWSYLLTTNKMLAARALGEFSPRTTLVCSREGLLAAIRLAGNRGSIVKPLRGRRGFGVLPLRFSEAYRIVDGLGFEPFNSKDEELEAVAIAIAFGGFTDLFCIVQPLVSGCGDVVGVIPENYRAVVLVNESKAEGVDVCRQFSADTSDARSSRIVSGKFSVGAPTDLEFSEVADFSVAAIQAAESWVARESLRYGGSACQMERAFMRHEYAMSAKLQPEDDLLLKERISLFEKFLPLYSSSWIEGLLNELANTGSSWR